MSLSSLFRNSAAPTPKPLPEQRKADAVVELIYAGNALATYLLFPNPKNSDRECVCGAVLPVGPETAKHRHNCPVARFKMAVEVVRKEAL